MPFLTFAQAPCSWCSHIRGTLQEARQRMSSQQRAAARAWHGMAWHGSALHQRPGSRSASAVHPLSHITQGKAVRAGQSHHSGKRVTGKDSIWRRDHCQLTCSYNDFHVGGPCGSSEYREFGLAAHPGLRTETAERPPSLDQAP